MTKPRTVLPEGDPRHGKYAGYQAGCGCLACARARKLYDAGLWHDRHHGKMRTVDATAAREHIDRLYAWGVRYTAYGESESNAPRIHRGEITRIHATTEAKILAVTPQPGINCFLALGAIRRLRALIALGHSQTELCRRLGRKEPHISMLVNEYRGQTHLETGFWLDVDRLFRELCMIPGTSTRSRNRGRERGWPVPLAWDNIDSPFEFPHGERAVDNHRRRDDLDEVVVIRVLNGEWNLTTTVAEKFEITRRWLSNGLPNAELCRLTGWREDRYTPGNLSETAVAS